MDAVNFEEVQMSVENSVMLDECCAESNNIAKCGGLRTRGHVKTGAEKKPLISVVTVVFNGEQYIEDTIKSVLMQHYGNVEYIIIDGGSSDNTLNIVRRYDDVIDYWISEPDRGIYDAMNKGITLANGHIIHLLNADDYYASEKVLDLVAAMNARVLSTSVNYMMEHEDKVLRMQGNLLDTIPHPGLFVSSSVYRDLRYSLDYKYASDIDFLLRLPIGDVQVVDEVTVNMRAGGAGASKASLNEALKIVIKHRRWKRVFYALTKKIYYFLIRR